MLVSVVTAVDLPWIYGRCGWCRSTAQWRPPGEPASPRRSRPHGAASTGHTWSTQRKNMVTTGTICISSISCLYIASSIQSGLVDTINTITDRTLNRFGINSEVSYPWPFLEAGHHDNGTSSLFPDHSPEITKGLRKWTLEHKAPNLNVSMFSKIENKHQNGLTKKLDFQ